MYLIQRICFPCILSLWHPELSTSIGVGCKIRPSWGPCDGLWVGKACGWLVMLCLCLSFTFWTFRYLLSPIALHLSSVHLCGGSLPKLCQKKILYAEDCIRSGNGSQGAPAPLFVKTPQSVFLKQWFIAHTLNCSWQLSPSSTLLESSVFSLSHLASLFQTCGQAV